MLKRFDEITRGKELRVGHHSIREEQYRPKTLNLDRNIQVAREIDSDNDKISFAIHTAKPIVP